MWQSPFQSAAFRLTMIVTLAAFCVRTQSAHGADGPGDAKAPPPTANNSGKSPLTPDQLQVKEQADA